MIADASLDCVEGQIILEKAEVVEKLIATAMVVLNIAEVEVKVFDLNAPIRCPTRVKHILYASANSPAS
jgi:hypothetical protein